MAKVTIKCVFDSDSNFIAVNREPDASAGEVAFDLTADQMEVGVSIGQGYYDDSTSTLKRGQKPPTLSAVQRAVSGARIALGAWVAQVNQYGATQPAARVQAAHDHLTFGWQALYLLMTEQNTGYTLSDSQKAAYCQEWAMGAADVTNAPTFYQREKAESNPPSAPSSWVSVPANANDVPARVNLADAEDVGGVVPDDANLLDLDTWANLT